MTKKKLFKFTFICPDSGIAIREEVELEPPFNCEKCGKATSKRICLECDCPEIVAWAKSDRPLEDAP